MSILTELTNKPEIEQFLRQDLFLHLYEIGDLDDFFWPDTKWFGTKDNTSRDLRAVALFYTGLTLPCLLVLERNHPEAASFLVDKISETLPSEFYAHFTPGLEKALSDNWKIDCKGQFVKMGLTAPARLNHFETKDVEPLNLSNVEELKEFYTTSYPGHWFEPHMLKTGMYFGIRLESQLACIAGVHVYSPEYRVAALGNIATAPEHRGKGLAKMATARLCKALLNNVDTIGLNVKADNNGAISCYRQIGFEPVAEYQEFSITKNVE